MGLAFQQVGTPIGVSLMCLTAHIDVKVNMLHTQTLVGLSKWCRCETAQTTWTAEA